MLLVITILGITLFSCGNNKTSSTSTNSSSTSISTSTSIINPSSSSSSSQEPSGDVTTVDGYRLVTSVNELDNVNKVFIGAYDSNQLYGMTPNAKSENLPWYITGESLKEANDHKDVKDITITVVWDLSKTGNSYKFSIDGKETQLELNDEEFVTVQMLVNGTSFTLRAYGDAEYVAFTSIKCYLAD